MSRVEQIREAIGKLSLEERAELMAALANFEDDEWDRQMKRDAAAGKFRTMSAQADADLKKGKTRPLGDLIRET